MMKNIVLFFGLLISLKPAILNAGYCQALHDEVDVISEDISPWRAIISKYLSSIIPGAIIGVTAGGFCAMFDHTMPQGWPLFWLASFVQREQLVHEISNDMKKRRVAHHKKIMWFSSLLTTWISYYHIYQELHGRPPF